MTRNTYRADRAGLPATTAPDPSPDMTPDCAPIRALLPVATWFYYS